MNRFSPALLALAVAMLGMVGCRTIQMGDRPAYPAAPVTAQTGEFLQVDQAYLVIDGSGSMHPPAKFPLAKQTAVSFASGMPDDNYLARFQSFGGEWEHEWSTWGPRKFERDSFRHAVDLTKWHGGSTPLDEALDILRPELALHSGDSAIILISDGLADPDRSVAALQAILDTHRGNVCVHTIQIGDDPAGRQLLMRLSRMGGCGTFQHVRDITAEDAMGRYIHEIFYGGERDSDGDGVPDHRDRCPDTPRGATVDEFGCWVIEGVLFDTDKSVIRSDAKHVLDAAAEVLRNDPSIYVTVEGHTDSRASDSYNLSLSQRRAESVKEALMQRGIGENRLHPKGFGESRPRVPNTSSGNMQLNRRVELSVID